jgi:uncharacterized FlgJ-related protein
MKILLISLVMLLSNDTVDLSPQSVYEYCVEQDIQHPEIVTAQAIQESGWFKCTHCSLNKNNIFGFWYKKQYIEFNNWKESILYYKRWQDIHYKGGDYYQFLIDRHFASDINYTNHIKNIVNKHAKTWVTSSE